MKTMKLLVFFVVPLAFFQCKTIATKNQVPIIEFEKMKCRGACPVFTLKIMADGSANYTGVENVEMIGVYEGNLDNEQLKGIIEAFDRINFFSLAGSYKSNMMDLQTKFVTYRKDGNEKKIKAYDNIPKSLNSLISKLDKLTGSLKWKKID